MTYNKKTRNEEMETELREDKIRELAHEKDDGDYETWCLNNKEDLDKAFWENTKEEREEFFKDEWREHNERF